MSKNIDSEEPTARKTPRRSEVKIDGKTESVEVPPANAGVKEATLPAGGVKERLVETGEHLQERLHEIAESAVEEVSKCADTYVQRSSERVREIEQTGHEAARKLSPQQPELLTYAIDYLANRVGGVADYLGERDAQDLMEDTRRLLRDHPVPTLGAFALLGIAAGRFLLAGSNSSEERTLD